MSKKRSKSSKNINDKWFMKMRGSYLPCSWQAWCCYLVAVLYISIAFAYIDQVTDNLGWIVFFGLKELIIVGVVLTWVAQQKS